MIGLPIVAPDPMVSTYERYDTQASVFLRILEEVRKSMEAIEGVKWSEFLDGSLAVTGRRFPGIPFSVSGHTHVQDLSCHTTVEKFDIRIGGLIRTTGELKAKNRWRDAVVKLQGQIEQAIRANPQWSELARSTEIKTRQVHEPVEGIASVTVTATITYATSQNDLTQPA